MQRLFIMLAIFYIIFIGGTAYTTNIPYLTIFFHVAVGLTIMRWLSQQIIQRTGWPQTPLDIPLGLYVALLAITTAFATDPRVAAEQAWLMAIHVVWFYMLVDLMRRGHQRWAFEGIFIATGVVALVSALEFASWYGGLGFAGYDQGWFAIGGLSNPIPPITYKLSLALNVSTILGNYVMVMLPIIIAWALSTPQKDLKVGLWLLAGGVALVLLGTGSRGALGAAVAAGGVFTAFQLMAWPRTRRIFQRQWVFPAMAVSVIGIGALLMLFAGQSESTSDQRRVDMWESAITFVGDQPLVGTGVGLFGVEYRTVRNTDFIQDKIVAAHNLWLNTAAEIGLGGLILLFWMGFVFLQTWYRHWQHLPRPQQIRYEGILAALAGFCVHSTIDMFSLSASVLPLLIFTAYVTVGPAAHTPQDLKIVREFRSPQRMVPIIVAILMLFSLGLLARTDLARLRMMGAWRALGERDYPTALVRFEDAKSADPEQGVYALQMAYARGLVVENYSGAVDTAINEHIAILKDNPTYDMGMANLSALYAQQAEYDNDPSYYENALSYIDQALEIHPDLWEYHFARARYLDKLGRGEEAQVAYYEALTREPYIALSPFWIMEDETLPSRSAAMQSFLAETTPDIQVQVGLTIGNAAVVTRAIDSIASPTEARDYLALARFVLSQAQLDQALSYYNQAADAVVPADTRELAAIIYAERAELHLTLGNTDDAQSDANRAIFIDRAEGARGYYVLAQLRIEDGKANEDTINQYLIQAVPPSVVLQEYAGTVYRSPAQLGYLPQLGLPGRGDKAYEPWLLLIERFSNDGDPETDPQDVIDVLEDTEPYTTLLDSLNTP